MKKNSFMNTKMKQYLNFSFKDANAEITKQNHKIFNASIKALVIYLFVILPIFAYTYVVLKNDNLTYYVNYRAGDQPIWYYLDIANGYLIKSFLYAGYGLLAASLIMICLFKPVVTATKAKKITMHGYLVAIGIIVILTLLFFGVSQYEYARFFEYYKYCQLFPDGSLKQDWAVEMTEQFKKSEGVHDWGWATTSVVIWIMFVQIMLSFTFFVLLQNIIFDSFSADKDSTKYLFMMDAEQHRNANDLTLNNRFWKRWRLFAHNDQRNLTIYIIIGSVAVLISSTVYSVLVTSSDTNISSLTLWNYSTPYLLRDLKGFVDPVNGMDIYDQIFGPEINSLYYGNLFLVSSLQIVCLGFTFSVLFFFITSFVRSKRVSYKIFFIQIIILFVFLLLTVTSVLVSKIYLYRIQDLWNTGDNSARLETGIKQALGNDETIWAKLTGPEEYPVNKIFNKGFKIEWLGFYPTIAEGILVYGFIIGLFVTVVINNQKLRHRTKEALDWINAKRDQALKEFTDKTEKAKLKARKIKKEKEVKVHEKAKARKTNKRTTRRHRGKTEE